MHILTEQAKKSLWCHLPPLQQVAELWRTTEVISDGSIYNGIHCSHFSPCVTSSHPHSPMTAQSGRPWHQELRTLLLSNNAMGPFASPSIDIKGWRLVFSSDRSWIYLLILHIPVLMSEVWNISVFLLACIASMEPGTGLHLQRQLLFYPHLIEFH